MTDEPHVHQFIAGTRQDKTPLVLLHGCGGDERDLVPLAGLLAPPSPVLALDGGFALFHRFPDRFHRRGGRVLVLADFIEAMLAHHSVTRAPIAIGYSNGAIMSAPCC